MIGRMDDRTRGARIQLGFPVGDQHLAPNSTVAASTGATLRDLSSLLQQKRVERQKLDADIQDLSGAINTLARIAGVVPPTTTQNELGPTTFAGMKIPEAIKAYLRLVGQPQYLSQITKGLIAGGATHNSSDIPNTVYMALRRGREGDDPDFKRFEPKKWGLASWENDLLKGGSFKSVPSQRLGTKKLPRERSG
jgi:hypothetical protein